LITWQFGNIVPGAYEAVLGRSAARPANSQGRGQPRWAEITAQDLRCAAFLRGARPAANRSHSTG